MMSVPGHAAVGVQYRMFAIAPLRSIGVANVAARAVTRPPGAVIVAARVLRYVAADGPLVADLRRGSQFGAFRKQSEALLDDGILHHLGERSHRSNLDAAVRRGANPAQLVDTAQIHHYLGLLDAVLQPVEAIQAAGQHPGVRSMLLEKFLRVSRRTRLQQVKSGHDISNYSHDIPPLPLSIKCEPSADAAWAGPHLAKPESYPDSPARAGKSRPPPHPKERSI